METNEIKGEDPNSLLKIPRQQRDIEWHFLNTSVLPTLKREVDEGMLITEEDDCTTYIPTISDGIMRSERIYPPAHYLMKIKSYSSIAYRWTKGYKSSIFDAGGYKWRIVFYPHGKNKDNYDKHVSLFLEIEETENLRIGWEVLVHFKLFVHDQINDKYLVIQDAKDDVKRFYPAKTEWGFDEVLSMDTFKDTENGYLVDDCCIFGAEIFVVQRTGKWECHTSLTPSVESKYTWKLNNFSRIITKRSVSESFTLEGIKWILEALPKGFSSGDDEYVSVFLILKDENLPLKMAVYAEYTLRVKDQINSRHIEGKASNWFYPRQGFGWDDFVSLKDLESCVLNDTLIVECQMNFLSKIEYVK